MRSAPVRRLGRLVARRTARDEEGRVVVEGVRAVEAALRSDATVEAVYAEPEAGSVAPALLELARSEGVEVVALEEGVLRRVCDVVTPQPVAAVVAMPEADLPGIADPKLLLVLVDVRDPGNAGAVVRVAEAAGASAVVFCRGSADAWSPKVVRASAGALFHVPVIRAGEAREVLEVLGQRGMRRLATVVRNGVAYHDVDWSVPTALVLGNEAEGVGDDLAAVIDAEVTVPMAGRIGSLNVATAAAVVAFEAVRERPGADAPPEREA